MVHRFFSRPNWLENHTLKGSTYSYSQLKGVLHSPGICFHLHVLNFLFLACVAPVDLGFLIDGSGSIEAYGTGNFKRCLDFVKKMAAAFDISTDKTHVGVVLFATNPELVFDFNKYFDIASIDLALDSMKYPNGGTYTGKALTFTQSSLFASSARPGKPHLLIILTDGASADPVIGPAKALRDSGVTIYSLGIGKNFNINQLNDMASDPDSDHVFTADFTQLDPVVEQIKNKACKG